MKTTVGPRKWIVILVAAGASIGCEERAWNRAREQETTKAFEAFIAGHPQSKHLEEARAAVRALGEVRPLPFVVTAKCELRLQRRSGIFTAEMAVNADPRSALPAPALVGKCTSLGLDGRPVELATGEVQGSSLELRGGGKLDLSRNEFAVSFATSVETANALRKALGLKRRTVAPAGATGGGGEPWGKVPSRYRVTFEHASGGAAPGTAGSLAFDGVSVQLASGEIDDRGMLTTKELGAVQLSFGTSPPIVWVRAEQAQAIGDMIWKAKGASGERPRVLFLDDAWRQAVGGGVDALVFFRALSWSAREALEQTNRRFMGAIFEDLDAGTRVRVLRALGPMFTNPEPEVREVLVDDFVVIGGQ